MAVDPWGGYNQGLAGLNETFTNIRQQDRQAALDAQTAAAARQQLAMGSLALQKAQREEDIRQGLRGAVEADAAAATPDVTTTAQNGGYSRAPMQPDVSARMLLGGAADSTPAKTRANEARYGVVSPTTVPTDTPRDLGFTPAPAFNPLESEMEQKAQAAAEPVTTSTTVKGQKANPLKAQVDYLNSIGESEKAMTLQSSVIEHANKVAALTGNPQDGLDIVNHATGEKLAYSPLPSLDAVTNDGQLVGYIDKNEYKKLITAGKAPLEAMKAAMIPLDLGGGGKAVLEYIAAHPEATADEIAGVGAKNGIPLSKMVPLLNETVKSQNEKNAMIRQDKQFAHAEEMQGRQFAQQNSLLQQRQSNKISINQLEPEEQDAINKAIGAGTLDPYKVNSRNQKTLAQAIMANPNVDLNALAAQLGVARNKDVVMKAGVAEMLPGLIQKTAEAGKALNYSDAKFIGSIEKWKNGQLNDPKLTRYMTLRNDQLLTIGSVVRGNGMTDMAQKLEEEAMHPTLAPKALDQWVEGQLESIDPRLNFYRKLTAGNKGIPRSNYQPGTGAKGLQGGATAYVYDPATGTLKPK